MFKTATIYKYIGGLPAADSLEEMLQANAFVPCGATQEQSIGWSPPRGEDHGALVESVNGHLILKLIIETKKVPSDVVQRKVDARCVQIEQETGRKPGKKERKELKDEVIIELLPAAFPARSAVLVWIDRGANTVVLDATGGKAALATTALVRSISEFALTLINTQKSPAAAMAHWLVSGEYPQDFVADNSLELKAQDETKARVKYDNHALDIEQIHEHIAQGKDPVKLALTWNDRVSFVLSDTFVLRKVDILDADELASSDVSAFDADVAIATGYLSLLFFNLIEALGGEVEYS